MLLSILSDKKEADVTEISYIRSKWHVAPKKILILGGICLRQGFWGNMQRLSLTGCDILCSFECEPKKISTLYVC